LRRALADFLKEEAAKNPDLVLLTADLGYGVFDDFRSAYPEQYVNVGIMEQLLVDAAAGMSFRGQQPVVYSIASFLTSRAYEQIKLSVLYNANPVLLIGAGGGSLYGKSGATHHAHDDWALMLGLPGMRVLTPTSPSDLRRALCYTFTDFQPTYIRIGKFGEPDFVASDPYTVGNLRKVDPSDAPLALLGIGSTLYACFQLQQLLQVNGVRADVIQCTSLRPFDKEQATTVLERYQHLVILEDHYRFGGLASLVSEILREAKSFSLTCWSYCAPAKFVDDEVIDIDRGLYFGFNCSDVASEIYRRLECN